MNNNDTALFAIPAILLLLLLLSFSSPSVIMAQQITAATTTPPLTPEEQEQQTRLQNVIAATNLNLDETEKEVNGIVYTPRWSNPVWVEADSLAVLVAYCLPGEFAESGQEILGGFELEVLESYEVALAQGFMAWMMVVGNEDRQDRLPAAVGVVCASDLNDAQTRVLSPQEQQQINNVIQQFITTQVTNIDQVINIINNVTTNATTTGGGPVMPPSPSTNDTGDGGGGGPPTECPQGSFYNSTLGQCEYPTFEVDCPQGSFYNSTLGQCEYPTITAVDTTPPVVSGPSSGDVGTAGPEGTRAFYNVIAEDNVDGRARLDDNNNLSQDNVGGAITISCNPPSGSIFPVGNTRVQCEALDQAGNVGTVSFTITVKYSPFSPPRALVGNTTAAPAPPTEEPPAEEEQQPPLTDEGTAPPPVEEEQPVTEEEEEAATTSPPANEGGGG
jgi:HYR domain